MEGKLLGERRENYCSSDEDGEDEQGDKSTGSPKSSNSNLNKNGIQAKSDSKPGSVNVTRPWDGVSKNTGPKGVIADWHLYQKHQNLSQMAKIRDLQGMVEKVSMTCAPGDESKPITSPMDELESDDLLHDFIKQRMQAMQQTQPERNQFGGVEEITSADHYTDIVDKTDPKVAVILHLYDNSISQCVTLNECLCTISMEHTNVKFCKMLGSIAGVSQHFRMKGMPALLVYKAGDLIGNFVQLKREFGEEFYAVDVENYLIENGILEGSK